MADGQILYGEVTLDGHKSLSTLGTDANGVIIEGSGGVTDHAALSNLDYASAGHTGFATSAQGALADTALQSETDPVFTAWDKSTGISITESQISDLQEYFTRTGQTAWRTFYSDGDGDVTALALGASGKVLTSNGVSSAPSWEFIPSTGEMDGGFANSVYLPLQSVDGGGASG